MPVTGHSERRKETLSAKVTVRTRGRPAHFRLRIIPAGAETQRRSRHFVLTQVQQRLHQENLSSSTLNFQVTGIQPPLLFKPLKYFGCFTDSFI